MPIVLRTKGGEEGGEEEGEEGGRGRRKRKRERKKGREREREEERERERERERDTSIHNVTSHGTFKISDYTFNKTQCNTIIIIIQAQAYLSFYLLCVSWGQPFSYPSAVSLSP